MIHTTFAPENNAIRETRTPVRLPDRRPCRALPRLGPEVLILGRLRGHSMPAVLTVDPRSGVPIYLQIIEQIKRSIALGVLQAASSSRP